MKRTMIILLIIVSLLFLYGFANRGITNKPGLRYGGNFHTLHSSAAVSTAGSYLQSEASANITDESGNKIITE